MRQAKSTGAFQNPLKHIQGKACKRCGKPATCAVITHVIMPACEYCAAQANQRGYDVAMPDMKTENIFSIRKDIRFIEADLADNPAPLGKISMAQSLAGYYQNEYAIDALAIAKRRIIRKQEHNS